MDSVQLHNPLDKFVQRVRAGFGGGGGGPRNPRDMVLVVGVGLSLYFATRGRSRVF